MNVPAVKGDFALGLGARVSGPALIEETDSTTLVPPGATVEIARDGSLLIAVPKREKSEATAETREEEDPVTLTVVNNALRNICDEMASAMVRTALRYCFCPRE